MRRCLQLKLRLRVKIQTKGGRSGHVPPTLGRSSAPPAQGQCDQATDRLRTRRHVNLPLHPFVEFSQLRWLQTHDDARAGGLAAPSTLDRHLTAPLASPNGFMAPYLLVKVKDVLM